MQRRPLMEGKFQSKYRPQALNRSLLTFIAYVSPFSSWLREFHSAATEAQRSRGNISLWKPGPEFLLVTSWQFSPMSSDSRELHRQLERCSITEEIIPFGNYTSTTYQWAVEVFRISVLVFELFAQKRFGRYIGAPNAEHIFLRKPGHGCLIMDCLHFSRISLTILELFG